MRIIAGEWRGRRFPVADLPGLRPTTDRVRETLFNWLSPDIAGRRCLDLFAGSGALGLESLSRGAGFCEFVETQTPAVRAMQQTLTSLNADSRARVVQANALDYLETLSTSDAVIGCVIEPFDLVFLDPPFAASELLQDTICCLADKAVLASDALVYLEYAPQTCPEVPTEWTQWRSKRSGGAIYELWRKK